MKLCVLVSIVASLAFPGCNGLGEICSPPCVPGDAAIMSEKEHGTSHVAVMKNLRWGCDWKEADRICNFNRRYAEPSGYWETTSFLDEIRELNGTISFYDSDTGKLLLQAPKNRSLSAFLNESRHHGWPSFRDAEVNWDNVRVLSGGETVSVDGTHLGHNLPDATGNRYCLNLVCIAAPATVEGTKAAILSQEEPERGLPPGVPALLVLVIVSVLVIGPSMVMHGQRARGERSFGRILLESHIVFRARCTAIVATVFWLWALYKVVAKGDPDLGVISFATVLIACGVTMASSSNSSSRFLAPKLMAASTTLVTLNYVLGIILTISILPWTFQLYLAVGATYWTAIGFWTAQGFRQEVTRGETTSLVSS